MKILILGAGGMIGHKMLQTLSLQPDLQVFGTLRKDLSEYQSFDFFKEDMIFDNLELSDFSKIEAVLNDLKPQVVLNCVGITLRKHEAKDLDKCLKLNSFLPHFLRCWAEANESFLIHFSTDCVFSGQEGPYFETSQASATDNYGRTKFLGEVMGTHALTLRGSMIGREIFEKTELLEWTLAQNKKEIRGYSQVIYSGVTTLVMAQLVLAIIKKETRPVGVFHVSSSPISKYDLLQKINKVFQLNQKIVPDESYRSNKLLISEKIKDELGFTSPPWDEMIFQLREDQTPYGD